MSSIFGKKLKISVFGESHANAIGVNIDGLPAGIEIDEEELLEFMQRRRGGQNKFSTKRAEKDIPEILSGFKNGKTTAAPLCAIIRNEDTRSSDYSLFSDIPRPSHADYTAFIKWNGKSDFCGGGHFSGRLTAPICIAGGIAKQILAKNNIFIGAHLKSVGKAEDKEFPMLPENELFVEIAKKDFPVICDEAGKKMKEEILKVRQDGDSIGGIIECVAIGVPAGIGDPMFDGVENRIAQAVFGIPAVKGIEFGEGFLISQMRGSQANDEFYIDENGEIKTKTNHSGGIQGGITNSMPIKFNVAIKPTPSIAKVQESVSISEKRAKALEIKGRHDPCIAQRAVPVVEAAAACVLLDYMIEYGRI